MEVFLLLIVFALWLALKVAFGAGSDPKTKDKKRFNAGLIMLQSKNYENALHYFTNMIKHYPKSAVAWYGRGKCNAELDNTYAAIADLTKSINLDIRMPEAYYEKSKIYFHLGDVKAAFTEADKAVWYKRNWAEAYTLRGRINNELGKEEEAISDFKKAVELGDEDAQLLLSRTLKRQERNK